MAEQRDVVNARKPSLWWNQPWTLVEGCTRCSAGCNDCWALAMEQRTGRAVEGGGIRLRWDRLDEPLHWRKPRVVAVWNDLFHPDVPDEFIEAVYGMAALCPPSTFIALTKRAERAAEWHAPPSDIGTREECVMAAAAHHGGIVWDSRGSNREHYYGIAGGTARLSDEHFARRRAWPGWPVPNVMLGVTCEYDAYLHRVEQLVQTPAAVRFVNAHLLGPLDLSAYLPEENPGPEPYESEVEMFDRIARDDASKVSWLAIECNRPFRGDPAEWWGWCESLVEQARAAGVPVWVKQGPTATGGVTHDLADFPEACRVREFPQEGATDHV